MSSSICLITTYSKGKCYSALQMKLVTSWPAHKRFIPIALISKRQKLKLALLKQQERMLCTNFPTKLCRVFNKLVYLVCLYNVLNSISPGIHFKCQVSSVLCNYRKKGLRRKINQQKKNLFTSTIM